MLHEKLEALEVQMVRLLSVKSAADALDVAPVTVIRLFDAGVLPGVVIAQRNRKRIIKFRPEAIDKFVTTREQQGSVKLLPGARRN